MIQSVVSAIKNTVSISQFNRGLAGKIFADVKNNGPKVVMKNNEAEVVLLSPQQYVQLMDTLNDYELLSLAVKRMEHYDPQQLITEEEMNQELNITQEEMDSVGEVDFE